MIEIDDKIVSADLLRECFACDIAQCKGICCVEGNAGAPLEAEEVGILEREYAAYKPYMTPEGIKAPVEAPKKLYAGGARGGLIRLGEPSDVLGIAEGIETALSARTLFKIPVWSAVSVGGFQNFTKVPDGVRKVVVFGDNDRSYAG